MNFDVVVIGSGVGGLSAALLLGARGLSVLVLEAGSTLGGKAGFQVVDGVEFDTGPSVLTLPSVFEQIFSEAGSSFADAVSLLRPEPAFRYCFAKQGQLDVHHELEQTLQEVAHTFGARARSEFSAYLQTAARIWEAAAPNFVLAKAPDWSSLLRGGPGTWQAVSRIDPFRTLAGAINAQVKTPELRMIFQRYATYNGSDPRVAPATLGCIAHVELGLGGFGIRGGVYELVRALGRLAEARGVIFELEARVTEVLASAGRIRGVRLSDGRELLAQSVVANADVAHLFEQLLPESLRRHAPPAAPASMSAFNAVYRAARRPERAPHAVLFPDDYLAEFGDIFDERRTPRSPSIYVCAQERAHARVGWSEEEPLFVMANAPPLSEKPLESDEGDLPGRVRSGLLARGWIGERDEVVWSRSPSDLASAFPGSRGSLYGAASNDKGAAFRRPANEFRKIPGLYLASGSAHPGGGLPLVAQSGRQAAQAVLRARRMA